MKLKNHYIFGCLQGKHHPIFVRTITLYREKKNHLTYEDKLRS